MKLYQVVHNKWNRNGRITFHEEFVIGFETEDELKYWVRGKDAMADDNESWVVWRMNY